MNMKTRINGSQLEKFKKKVHSLHVPDIKTYREEAVGLKSSNCTLKIMIFVKI